MKSLLEDLFVDENFGIDSTSMDTGVMMNEYNDLLVYMILEYNDRVEVYLELDDEDEPPYRNIMAKGIAGTVEAAKKIAVENLHKQAYKNKFH